MNEKDLENEEKRKYMEGRIPLGRTGVTEDMVGPAVFLASDMSRYVVGDACNCWRSLADLGRLEHSYLLTEGYLSICNKAYQLKSISVLSISTSPIRENEISNRTRRICPSTPLKIDGDTRHRLSKGQFHPGDYWA